MPAFLVQSWCTRRDAGPSAGIPSGHLHSSPGTGSGFKYVPHISDEEAETQGCTVSGWQGWDWRPGRRAPGHAHQFDATFMPLYCDFSCLSPLRVTGYVGD